MKDSSEQDLRKSQYKLIISLLLIIFVAILVYTIIWEVNYQNKYGFFQKTTAEVVDHEVIDNQIYDVIEYTVDSVDYRKTTSYVSKNNVGDKITIYYDESSPIGVIYNQDNRVIILPIITITFGVVCVCLVITYFWIFKPNLKSTMQRSKKSHNQGKN